MFVTENVLENSDCGFAMQKRTYFENTTMPELHYHNHYEILYVTENERLLTVNGNRCTLDGNTIALIPPYIPHLTEAGTVVPQKRILIDFRADFLQKIRKAFDTDILSCFNASNPIIRIEDKHKLSLLLTRLSEAANSSNQLKNEYILLALTELLLFLCEYADKNPADFSFSEILAFIEEHFSEKITLDTLSEKFFISKYTISRRFKSYTGMGLPKYLNTIRLINAKKQLAGGEKIIDVALSCGFESVSNFDRVFSAYIGMSPKKYKNTIRKQL